ncbi:MAG: RnfH family protein [Pseudomonadota bacterium]
MDEALITVEVAYALPNKQLIIPVQVPQQSNIEAAIHASGILQSFPEINLSIHKVGIFGKLTKLDANIRHLDRIEIYRPLIADPKALRRKRATDRK